MTDSLDAKVARLEEAHRQQAERQDEQDEEILKLRKLLYGRDLDGQSGTLYDLNKMKAEARYWKAAYFFGGAFGTAVISWVTNYVLPAKPGAH